MPTNPMASVTASLPASTMALVSAFIGETASGAGGTQAIW